jgi:[citrate (pro-3S)-lyase] ligase
MALESTQLVYAKVRDHFMRKGVEMCEFALPKYNTITYKTELEWQSIELKAEARRYIMDENDLSERQKNCVEKIYGADVLERMKELWKMKEPWFDRPLQIEAEKFFCGNRMAFSTEKADNRKKRIYLIGPCIVAGYGCLTEATLLSALSKEISGSGYQVIGIPLPQYDYEGWSHLDTIPIRQGDIVCVINEQYWFPEKENRCKRIDLTYVYNNRDRKTMFSEVPIHTNAEGNRVLAKEMYESYLKDAIARWKDCGWEFLQKGEVLNRKAIAEIAQYTGQIKQKFAGGGRTTGSIVMNCNPFTCGHRYLVEYAAKQVDTLYIFVVEEDRSVFRFEDRMKMVEQGTADLKNVIVVPSGRWVISYDTLPIYFEKAIRQEAKVDASRDLEIFARYIAPPLGITKRFVGEEPTDRVTGQYNEQMEEILGDFGIDVEIVPRKEMDGVAVSASQVRAYMEEGNWEAVKRLVPESTWRCLRGSESDLEKV